MSDILETAEGDIDLTANDASFCIGSQEVLQRVRQRLRCFKGEWYLNTSIGIDYFNDIFVANPNMTIITAIFKREILATPGIIKLTAFSMSIDRVLRKLSITFSGTSVSGDVGPVTVEI